MKLRILALSLILWATGLVSPQPSQGSNQLNEQLRQAICGQNWYRAIQIIQRMKQLAPQDAGRLTVYQNRLQSLAERNLRLPDWNCATEGLPTAADDPAGEVFTVPIVARLGGIPVVAVTFNGEYTYNMLFDTGASTTFILPSMAREIQVEVTGQGLASLADGRIIPTFFGEVESLQLGNLSLSNVTVSFDDQTNEIGLDGMGLLGQNVYGVYDVTIRENEIELRSR